MTPDATLALIGTAFENIARSIAARLAAPDGTSPAQVFDECTSLEVERLRSAGEGDVAENISTIRNPIHRFLSVGW